MAYEMRKYRTVTLKLSPSLYRQLELAARNAGKPLEPTIKSLLWIGMGQFNLRTPPETRPKPF